MDPKTASTTARKKKKVTMERIVNDSARKSTCRKRGTSVVMKTRDLSTLCGVEALAVIFPGGGESSSSSSSQMQVWPPLPEATSIVERFRSLPEAEQRRKGMDAEGCARERVGKIQEQLRKAERENRQRETTLLIHHAMVGQRENLGGLTVEQLAGMGWTTDNLIKKIKDRIAYINGTQQTGVKADPLPYAATVADLEAPQLQQGWVTEMVMAGRDLNAVACSSGSGSYGGSVGAGGDVMQLGSMDAGFAWGDPAGSIYFRPI